MTNYNDGEIHLWKGGFAPVHKKTFVNLWYRNFSGEEGIQTIDCIWQHASNNNELDSGEDIIAFQVVKEYKEPECFWRNEYSNRNTFHESEKAAKMSAARNGNCLRVAVPYIEKTNDQLQ